MGFIFFRFAFLQNTACVCQINSKKKEYKIMNPKFDKTILYTIFFVLLASRYTHSLFVFLYDYWKLTDRSSGIVEQAESATFLLIGFSIIIGFPLIAIAIAIGKDNLPIMNVDKGFVFWLIITGAVILYRLPYNCLAGISLYFFAILLLKNKNTFSQPHFSYKPFLILIAYLLIRIFFFSNNLSRLANVSIEYIATEILLKIIGEEFLFRGALFMALFNLNLSDYKIQKIHFLLFWMAHISFIIRSPYFFWIEMPIISFILGHIAIKTKSLFASTSAHVIINLVLLAN